MKQNEIDNKPLLYLSNDLVYDNPNISIKEGHGFSFFGIKVSFTVGIKHFQQPQACKLTYSGDQPMIIRTDPSSPKESS